MQQHRNCHEQPDERHVGKGEAIEVLPTSDDARGAQDAQQLDQPEEAQRAHQPQRVGGAAAVVALLTAVTVEAEGLAVLHRHHGASDELEVDHGQQVDQKPRLQVCVGERGGGVGGGGIVERPRGKGHRRSA